MILEMLKGWIVARVMWKWRHVRGLQGAHSLMHWFPASWIAMWEGIWARQSFFVPSLCRWAEPWPGSSPALMPSNATQPASQGTYTAPGVELISHTPSLEQWGKWKGDWSYSLHLGPLQNHHSNVHPLTQGLWEGHGWVLNEFSGHHLKVHICQQLPHSNWDTC